MKKLKVLIPIAILLILVILIGLSFLRLPMNILSQEMVERETKGFVTLNSLSNPRIISNKFKYKGSDLYFDIYTTDSEVNKIDFSIENLEIDELVLLLGGNYQEVLKKINFQSLDIKGEYVKENLNIEDLVITLADKSQISIEGNINLSNFISSDLSIRGQNISSDNLFQMISKKS